MEITELNQLDLSKAYTVKEYLSWKFQEKVELLKGYITKRSPAPSSGHQRISGNIHGQLWSILRNRKCQLFSAPFDVYLPSLNGVGETVVQPDLCVICDVTKIKKQGCVGTPDLIIEILSPGNARREMKDKYEIYELAGVKEYWVVFPSAQVLQVYLLKDEVFVPQKPYTSGDIYTSAVLEGFALEVESIFENMIEFE